jgi:hypothetical protein
VPSCHGRGYIPVEPLIRCIDAANSNDRTNNLSELCRSCDRPILRQLWRAARRSALHVVSSAAYSGRQVLSPLRDRGRVADHGSRQ